MASRVKEDEKNEKAIRSLLRKAPNRRCINCNSLGPQYVCLNFWTFVCTQCSGIHREFTHRVKSVSMSKFTSQEVANLETGGNECGRDIYFKDWDSQRQPPPDSSNVDRLREFIKMVYVDKRFSGERPLPHPRGGDREETYDKRSPEPRSNYRADYRSPSYEERYDDRTSGGRRSNASYDDRRYDDRRYNERGRFDEKRSPGRFETDRNRNDKYYNDARFDEKRSPGRFETDRNRNGKYYNDARRYDDRPPYESRGDRQHYEDRHNEGLDRRFEDRFANEKGKRNYGGGSPPPVRPVKEILGEDVPPLRVENHGSQINGGGRELDKSHSSQDGHGQRFGSSSSFGSSDGNIPAAAPTPVVKREDSASLIDFSVEPELPAAPVQPDPFGLIAAVQPSVDASNSTGWATFGSADPMPPAETFAQAPTAQGVSGGFSNPTNVIHGNSQWASLWSSAPLPSAIDTPASSWPSLGGPSVSMSSSQPWNAFQATATEANAFVSPQMAVPFGPQTVSSSAGVATQVTPTHSSGRPEIPEDIFGASLSSVQYTGGPQFSSMGGMGVPLGHYSQPPKSRNPFDLPGDSGAGPGEFPTMHSMQAALPNLGSGPRPVPGTTLSGYGLQWNQPNSMAQPPASRASGPLPTGGGLPYGQQSQTAIPQTMQGPSAHSLGANLPGSFHNAPNQATDLYFAVSSFQQQPPTQIPLGGGTESMFTAQGAGSQFPYHHISPPAGPASFMASPGGQPRLQTQSSLGSLPTMPGAESVFPTQLPLPGQRLVSYASLGSLSALTGQDSQHSLLQPSSQFLSHTGPDSQHSLLQPSSQFLSHSSTMGSAGANPFG